MFKYYVKRTIKKIVSIPLYVLFIFASLIVKPVSALLRFVSIPLSIIAFLTAGINFFNGGVFSVTIQLLSMTALFVLTHIKAPCVPSYVYKIKQTFKENSRRPIVIRPPVRFTA